MGIQGDPASLQLPAGLAYRYPRRSGIPAAPGRTSLWLSKDTHAEGAGSPLTQHGQGDGSAQR